MFPRAVLNRFARISAVLLFAAVPAKANGVFTISENYAALLASQDAGRCAMIRGSGGTDVAAERFPGSDKTVDDILQQLHRDLAQPPGVSRDRAIREGGIALACVALVLSVTGK